MPLRRLADSYRLAFAGLPREVWLLAVATLVNRSGTMVLPFMALYLTRELGFSALAAGRVLSLYGLGSMVGSLLGGRLTDRLGAVRVQELSLLGVGAGFLVLAQLRTHWLVALAVFLVSTVGETFRPALMTAAALSSPPAVRTRSLALIRLAVNLGMSVGPAVGGLLASRHYGWLFVGDAVTCWAAAVVLFLTLHRPQRLTRPPAPPPGRTLRSPWRDGPYLVFLALVVLHATAFFQILTTFPLYLRSAYGLGEATIGALLALNAVCIVLFEMQLVRRVEHRDHLRLAALGALLVGAGMALLPFGRGVAYAAFTVLVWTAGEMLSLPLNNATAASRADPASSGRYLGAYSFSFSTAFVLAPTVGAAIYETLGPTTLWLAVGAAGLVLATGFSMLAPRFKERETRDVRG